MLAALAAMLLAGSATVAAQTQTLTTFEVPRPPRFSTPPTDVEVLLGCQAVLHAVDMFTTAYDLSFEGGAREANVLLRPLGRHPPAMTAASGAINVLQAYTLTKIQRTHPKIARWWALALVGVEVWR